MANWIEYNDSRYKALKTFDYSSLAGQYSEPALRHMALSGHMESRNKPGWTHVEIAVNSDGWRIVHGIHQHYQGSGTSTFPELMLAYAEEDSSAFREIMGPYADSLLSSQVRYRRYTEDDLPERFARLGERFGPIQIAVAYRYYYEPIARKIKDLGLSWDVGYAMAFDRALVHGWAEAIRRIEEAYKNHGSSGEGAIWAAFAAFDDLSTFQARRQWIWAGDPVYGRAIDAPHAPVTSDPIANAPGVAGGGASPDGDALGQGGADFPTEQDLEDFLIENPIVLEYLEESSNMNKQFVEALDRLCCAIADDTNNPRILSALGDVREAGYRFLEEGDEDEDAEEDEDASFLEDIDEEGEEDEGEGYGDGYGGKELDLYSADTTRAELLAYAASHDIHVRGRANKAEIIETIRAARGE